MSESLGQFETRKADHLRIALDDKVQVGANGLESIRLEHEALPDFNFSEISTTVQFTNLSLASPFFISSMTAGHGLGISFNLDLARLSQEKNILMGVGSQRRQLTDSLADQEWLPIRDQFPKAKLIANIGISQLIGCPVETLRRILQSLDAKAIFVHLNSLQECLQPEGTPQFRGASDTLRDLCSWSPVPVVIKEVGCGFSSATLARLFAMGIYAVDIGGMGGTHWGRIEGMRALSGSQKQAAAEVFADWGINTLQSLQNYHKCVQQFKGTPIPQLWSSGGVRTGLDAAKLLALGSEMVGLAQPWLKAWSSGGYAGLDKYFQQLDFELRVAMFCTGSLNLKSLKSVKVIHG